MFATWNDMWSIVSGCGVPLNSTMVIASFVRPMPSSNRNISSRSKFCVQNCALRSGSRTAKLKCPTAPSLTFTADSLLHAGGVKHLHDAVDRQTIDGIAVAADGGFAVEQRVVNGSFRCL